MHCASSYKPIAAPDVSAPFMERKLDLYSALSSVESVLNMTAWSLPVSCFLWH